MYARVVLIFFFQTQVVDSQNISTPNGMHLQQRKELEVLQTRTDIGSFQVVRSSTIQTSSSRTKMPSTTNIAIESSQLSPEYMVSVVPKILILIYNYFFK